MERALALTNEAPRHPLRRLIPSLPAIAAGEIAESGEDRWENTRLFLMTFVAGFIAFYGMIA